MKTLKDILNRNQTFMTRTINDLVAEKEDFAKEIVSCLERHFENDFGEVGEKDIQANMKGIESDLLEDRVLSKYNTSEGDIYIITELYHAEGFDIITNIMFCEEY